MERSNDLPEFRSDDRPGRGGQRRRHEGFGPRGRGRGRMQRGDIRTAVLAVLSESTGHGYEIIQVIEAKSDGAWRPSPGSVYPTLQLLEDEGMVRSTEREGKRVFEITAEGRAEAAERIEQAGGAPWDLAARAGGSQGELRRALGQLAAAAKQVGGAGSPEQVERAVAVLADARKSLYGILAED